MSGNPTYFVSSQKDGDENRWCFSPKGESVGLLPVDSNSTNHKNETAGYEEVAIRNMSLICFA